MYDHTIYVLDLCNPWEPFVDELKELWDVGVETYDISMGHTFRMKAALIWTINDFPVYVMLSG